MTIRVSKSNNNMDTHKNTDETMMDPPDLEANLTTDTDDEEDDRDGLQKQDSASTMEPTESTQEATMMVSGVTAHTKSSSSHVCCRRIRWSRSTLQKTRKLRQHLKLEKELLQRSWKVLFFCGVIFQYIHSVATNLVYYLHEPADEPLKDLGFALLPALDEENEQIVSEIIFVILITITVLSALYPLLQAVQDDGTSTEPQRYTIVMMTRYGRVLVTAQTLRILSFLSTILPSPNYHCREDAEDYQPPQSAADIFLRLDAVKGCGDLIFSSHTIFVTLGALTIHHYYPKRRYLKAFVWALVVTLGLLIVATRKHYTVDVVVAWYTCPLLWFYVDKTYPDDAPTGTSQYQDNPNDECRNNSNHNHNDDDDHDC